MAKKYNIVFMCKNNTEGVSSVTRVEEVAGPSFKCPRCGMQLVWLAEKREFGAHGKTKDNIKHELRKVEELR